MFELQGTELTPDPDIFCSVMSRDMGEPLLATAVSTEFWFLLEYDGPWREKATTDNELPPEVQLWLNTQLEATMGRGRVQFIKQERERPSDHLTFYVVHARDTEPMMYRLRLDKYQDLLPLDGAALVAGSASYEEVRQYDPMYLVCTNGRRDRCCALYGLEVYRSLQAIAGDAVWQTTHVGGHRFAANVLTFPDGTYYGRVQTREVEGFYQARERGEVALEYLRGRSCYEEAVQAADYYLRRETGERALDAFHYSSLWSPATDDFEVTFAARGDGATYEVRVRREALDLPIYASCGKPQVEPVTAYRLMSLKGS